MSLKKVRKGAHIPAPLLKRVKRGELAKLIQANLEAAINEYEVRLFVTPHKEQECKR